MKRTTTLQLLDTCVQVLRCLGEQVLKKSTFKRINTTRPDFSGLTLSTLLLLTIFTNETNASCVMACNDQVNVSLPSSCEAEITYDMILEDPNNPALCSPNGPSAYVVTVMDLYGNVIPTSPVVTEEYIGDLLSVKVKHWASGNSCWGNILIQDKLPPVLICPDDITIACTEPTDTSNTGILIADDCSNFVTSFFDYTQNFGCNNPVSIITRTFTGVDQYGNTSNCKQTISIEQPLISDVQFPPNWDGITGTALPCENPNTDPSHTGWPHINGSPIISNGPCNMAVTYNDLQLPICDGAYKILRTWTVAEWCVGVIITHTQIIKVADDEGPELVCPSDLTVGTTSSINCLASILIPPVQATDNCSSTFTYQVTTPGGILNTNGGLVHNISLGIYTITYTVSDGCGNQSTCAFTLTVVDDDAPAVICDEFTVVSLQPDGYVTIFAQTFDDGSYDNCCLDFFEARRMDDGCGFGTDFGPSVEFCCDDIGEDVQVELRVVDCAGNANTCMVVVHVDDKTDPTILCPPTKTISCTEDYLDTLLTGIPVVNDGCGIANLTHTNQVNLNTCHVGTVVRTWTVTDNYGNSSSCTQLINVVDNTPVTVTFPLDYDLVNGCTSEDSLHPDSLPAPHNYPIMSGDDCELMATNWNDVVFQVAPPACFKIVRTWTVIDWCTYLPNSGSNNGMFSSQQILKVFDNEAPVLTCPDDFTVEIIGNDCVASLTLPAATVEDCSQSTTISLTSDFGSGDGPFYNIATGTYSATYNAMDGCGNSSSCSNSITVVDSKQPTPYCKNGLIVEIMSSGTIEIWASDFDDGSFDNCPGDVLISFSADVDSVVTVFDCFDVGQQSIQMWVTDASGNQDFCNTHIVIQDNMGVCNTGPSALVAGMVTNEMGAEVESVTISVNDGVTDPIVTGATGDYGFQNLIIGHDYTVAPEKNMNPLNGVTTWDLVILRKHILHIQELDSPYKLIAADANNSGTVTTTDMVEIQKVILFIHDDFPNNTSWRFVDKEYSFPDPANPWSEVFPEVYNINNLDEDMMDVNFTGVKIGDLNNSAIPNMLTNTDDRSEENLVFELDDKTLQKGETYKLDFRAKDFSEIQGFQFTLQFDTEVLDFVGVQEEALALSKYTFGMSRLESGILTASWHTLEHQNLEEDAVLFSLVFATKSNELLSKTMKMNSKWTSAEAYRGNGENLGVTLQFNGENGILSSFELYQNRPNPFYSATIVSFSLPETQEATLKLYDISGGLLKVITDVYPKGLNQVEVYGKDLPTKGTIIYQLQTANDIATRKMILL